MAQTLACISDGKIFHWDDVDDDRKAILLADLAQIAKETHVPYTVLIDRA